MQYAASHTQKHTKLRIITDEENSLENSTLSKDIQQSYKNTAPERVFGELYG